MKYEVRQNGNHPLVIETSGGEDAAKAQYEIERGLVSGVNPLTVMALAEAPKEASPFGLHRSDRYEPYVKPEPPKPAPKPVAAEEVTELEEVLLVE